MAGFEASPQIRIGPDLWLTKHQKNPAENVLGVVVVWACGGVGIVMSGSAYCWCGFGVFGLNVRHRWGTCRSRNTACDSIIRRVVPWGTFCSIASLDDKRDVPCTPPMYLRLVSMQVGDAALVIYSKISLLLYRGVDTNTGRRICQQRQHQSPMGMPLQAYLEPAVAGLGWSRRRDSCTSWLSEQWIP